ncbi:pilin isopeptide linkage protein [Breznakia blatticola]|uniref:Pilin isopeptide linkage protein n=1 Tax=Breznakia blatticola TaxID=1754012 RepID=A0A4R7Z9H5_9FIRM|nr:FctA domain-containing protein [Breznakia blatticola]TDW09824.1 pilin isopeptide linkage protein [Breznakia blatticola]
MKKLSKLCLAFTLLIATYFTGSEYANVLAKETEWISQINITHDDESELFKKDEMVGVDLSWDLTNDEDTLSEKRLYFPEELQLVDALQAALTNTNGVEVGTAVVDVTNQKIVFNIKQSAVDENAVLKGNLRVNAKVNTDKDANLVFKDHNDTTYTKTLALQQAITPYFNNSPGTDVTNDFIIKELILEMATYDGAVKHEVYHEVNGSKTGSSKLEWATFGNPAIYYQMDWGIKDSNAKGYEAGDYIKFELLTLSASEALVNSLDFGEKDLIDPNLNRKLAVGTVEKVKNSDGTYTLFYVITFDPEPDVDLPTLTDMQGNMKGDARFSGGKKGDKVVIDRNGETFAEIDWIDRPDSTNPGVIQDGPRPSSKVFTNYQDSTKTIQWNVVISDYASHQFDINTPYDYEPLIFEEYVDFHQTFNAFPEDKWRDNGVSVRIAAPIYLRDSDSNRTFEAFSMNYNVLIGGTDSQKGGMQYIAPAGDTDADMQAVEATVRATNKSWTVVTEPDGYGHQRERMIVNFGSPGKGDNSYLKVSDFTTLADLKTQILTIKADAQLLIDENSTATDDTLIQDKTSAKIKFTLKEWKQLVKACDEALEYYKVDRPALNFKATVTTRVKVTQAETGAIDKVSNGYRVSGGWTENSKNAEALNSWGGTITAKPVNGDVVIYKADSLYGNSTSKDDDSAIHGGLGNAKFKIYRKTDLTTPLTFKYADGKYEYNAGATDTEISSPDGSGRFIITKLAEGDYVLVEVASPDGFYQTQNQSIEFKISSTAITYKLLNNVPRSVELKKVDEKTKDALAGAVFELYKYDSDINNATKVTGFTKTQIAGEDWYFHDSTGTDALEVISSGADKGKLRISRLDAGNYYFKEIVAPSTYAVSNEKYTFTLDENYSNGVTTVDIGDIENKLYTATGDITFAGTKTLTGRNFKAGDTYSFKLYGVVGGFETPLDTKTITPTSGSSETFTFKKLNYTLEDAGKTYTYKIKEEVGSISGVTYATNEYTASYEITDNGDGTLSVTKTSGTDLTTAADVAFTNTYAATGSIAFGGTKTLTGRNFASGDTFTFELYKVTGSGDQIVDTQTINPTSGSSETFTFKTLNYTLADKGQTYTYKIVETGGSIAGVTYDTTVYTADYTITDNGDGTLSVTKASGTDLTSASDVTFTNTYAATGSIAFAGTKTLTGRDFASGDSFTFELYEVTGSGDQIIDTKTITPTSGTSETFTFKTLNYTLADKGQTYTYKIIEKPGTVAGVTYDTTEYTASYTITDNGNGTLSVTKASGTDLTSATAVEFENTYGAVGNIKFAGTKTLTGRNFASGDTFTFELYRVDGSGAQLIDTKTITPTSGSSEAFTFKTINYALADKGNTYTYKIKETIGNISGVTYDTTEYTATYDITDNGNGTLSATKKSGTDLTSASDVTFTNTYAASGNITFAGSKTLTGRDFKAGDTYSFELIGVVGGFETPLDTQTITPTTGSSETFTFKTLNYTLADKGNTYTYKIKETIGNISGVTYDTTEYTANYTITDNGDGTLSVTKTSGTDLTSSTAVTFTNTYAATGSIAFGGTKTLTGRNYQSGDTFSFELYKVTGSGDQLLDTQTINPTSGTSETFTFKTLDYTLADKGQTYTYKIVETSGSVAGVTYDTTVYTANYTITDNGNGTLSVTKASGTDLSSASDVTFTNTYAATGSIAFAGTKTLTGRNFAASDTFSFELYKVTGSGDQIIDTQTINPTSGTSETFTFKTLDYTLVDKGQTYTYKIVEKAGTVAGVTYDTTVYTADYTIADNGDGTLSVTKASGTDLTSAAAVEFENTYGAAGNIKFAGTKTLTGRNFASGDSFTFELYKVDGSGDQLLDTKTINPTSGSSEAFTFKTLNYALEDKGKTYTYKIVEKAETLAGVTYDTTVYTATYDITDNGNGTLSATKKSGTDLTSASDVTFTNTYAATGSIAFAGTKTLTGRNFAASDSFTFELYKVDGSGDQLIDTQTITPTSGSSKTFTFKTLNYTLADKGQTYTYKIVEKAGSIAGITYDTTEYTANYTVADNGDGTLSVTKASGTDLTSAAAVEFENTYAAVGSITFAGSKTLTGRNFTAGDTFTFELYKVDGSGDTLLETKVINPTSGSNEAFTFNALSYSLADKGKTYTYKIVEKAESIAGITYDTTTYTASYEIEDGGDGTVVATRKSGTDLTSSTDVAFENTYAANASIAFSGTKALSGRDFKAGDTFTFELYAKVGGLDVLIDTKTITPTSGSNETFTFKTLNYTLADKDQLRTYKIKEKVENISGITYDTTEYTATYEVTDNGDGTLRLTRKSGTDLTSASDVTFTNTYAANGSVSFAGTKTLTGRNFTATDVFSFDLYKVEGSVETLVDTQTINPTNGSSETFTFKTMNYTLADKGKTYTYKIVEKAGSIDGITYDTTTYTATYEIVDNGDGTLAVQRKTGTDLTHAPSVSFVNAYKAIITKGDVVLHKIDSASKNALEGAEFSLYKADGTLVTEKLVSDANGVISAANLDEGNYYFQETKAPKGYQLNKEKINFEIKANQTTAVSLMFENKKTPDKPVVFRPSTSPNTGDPNNTPYYLFMLLLSGVVISGTSFKFARAKKRK